MYTLLYMYRLDKYIYINCISLINIVKVRILFDLWRPSVFIAAGSSLVRSDKEDPYIYKLVVLILVEYLTPWAWYHANVLSRARVRARDSQNYSRNARKGEKVKIAERKWVHHYASRVHDFHILYIFTLVTHNSSTRSRTSRGEIAVRTLRAQGLHGRVEKRNTVLIYYTRAKYYAFTRVTLWQMYHTNTESTLPDEERGWTRRRKILFFFFRRAHQESFSSRCETIVMNKTFRRLQFVPASLGLKTRRKACPAII